MLIFPQDAHERMLVDLVATVGVSIERPTEPVGFDDRGDRITAQLKHADGSVEANALRHYVDHWGLRTRGTAVLEKAPQSAIVLQPRAHLLQSNARVTDGSHQLRGAHSFHAPMACWNVSPR